MEVGVGGLDGDGESGYTGWGRIRALFLSGGDGGVGGGVERLITKHRKVK